MPSGPRLSGRFTSTGFAGKIHAEKLHTAGSRASKPVRILIVVDFLRHSGQESEELSHSHLPDRCRRRSQVADFLVSFVWMPLPASQSLPATRVECKNSSIVCESWTSGDEVRGLESRHEGF